MKTESAFREYYDSVIIKQLDSLNLLRLKANQRKKIVIIALVGISILIALFWMTLTPALRGAALVFYIGFIGAVYKFEVQAATSRYEDQFKNELIGGIVKFIAPDFEYEAITCIPEAGFCISDIYGQSCRGYSGSDHIEGDIGETHIKFSWVDAVMYNQEFKGLFFLIDFNKNFEHETFIITKDAHSAKSHLVDKMHFGRPPLIDMDHTDFQYKYAVYGTDQLETMYILTPALMDRILAYGKKTGFEINLSFVRSTMFVSLTIGQDLFKPDYKKEPDQDTIIEWFTYLNNAFDLVDDLNLNTRIWGKED
jgi:hypothetical protein